MSEPLTPEEEAALRSRIDALIVAPDIGPGPWHPEGFTSGEGIGGWFDNETGDSSFPGVDDVGLLLNEVPRLLATLDAARAATPAAPEALREANSYVDPVNEYQRGYNDGVDVGIRAALAASPAPVSPTTYASGIGSGSTEEHSRRNFDWG